MGTRYARKKKCVALTAVYQFCFANSINLSRGTEKEDALQRRLANAKAEMEYGLEADNFEKVSEGLIHPSCISF